MRVVDVVLVQRVVVSSQVDDLVFVFMVRHLFVFRHFERVKYIRLDTTNQINCHQYVAELELKIL